MPMTSQLTQFIETLDQMVEDNVNYKDLQKAIVLYQTGLRAAKKQLIKNRFNSNVNVDLRQLETVAGKYIKESVEIIKFDPEEYMSEFYEEMEQYNLSYQNVLESLSQIQEGLAEIQQTLSKDKCINSDHILDACILHLYKAFAALQ
jgi:hypothetical protein